MDEQIVEDMSGGDFSSLSDLVLTHSFDLAKDDLHKASVDAPNSEWHQSCFAAVYLMATEMGNRGLIKQTTH